MLVKVLVEVLVNEKKICKKEKERLVLEMLAWILIDRSIKKCSVIENISRNISRSINKNI